MDVQSMIGKVAAEHGFRLGPRDPLFAEAVIIKSATDDAVAVFAKAARDAADNVTVRLAIEIRRAADAAQEAIQMAQVGADARISQSGTWAAERFRELGTELAASISAAAKAAAAAPAADAKRAERAARVAMAAAGMAGGLVSAAMFLLIWSLNQR